MSEKEVDQLAFDRGRAEAQREISSGRLRLFLLARGAWGRDLVETMRDRFGVEVVNVSCLTDIKRKSFEEGYNAETVLHVDSIFGTGSYSRAYDEIQIRRKQRYDEQFPSAGPDCQLAGN